MAYVTSVIKLPLLERNVNILNQDFLDDDDFVAEVSKKRRMTK